MRETEFESKTDGFSLSMRGSQEIKFHKIAVIGDTSNEVETPVEIKDLNEREET